MERLYRIILAPESEGGFVVTVPSLPGCKTLGEDIEHAKSRAREAISLYIEDMVAQGEDIPDDNSSLELTVVMA